MRLQKQGDLPARTDDINFFLYINLLSNEEVFNDCDEPLVSQLM